MHCTEDAARLNAELKPGLAALKHQFSNLTKSYSGTVDDNSFDFLLFLRSQCTEAADGACILDAHNAECTQEAEPAKEETEHAPHGLEEEVLHLHRIMNPQPRSLQSAEGFVVEPYVSLLVPHARELFDDVMHEILAIVALDVERAVLILLKSRPHLVHFAQ